MADKKQTAYGVEVVAELGEWVGRVKEKGLADGLTEEEIREVWTITFGILSKKL